MSKVLSSGKQLSTWGSGKGDPQAGTNFDEAMSILSSSKNHLDEMEHNKRLLSIAQ